jgi:hypothetical protein
MPFYEHMFKDHNIGSGTKIWRYMDLSKFLSMIDTNSLYFTRADKFDDPYEGTTNLLTKITRREKFQNIDETTHLVIDQLPLFQRKFTAINCWHASSYESAAMWGLYLKSGEGIAIQTTYKNLCDSFNPEESDIYVGKGKYVDFETEGLDDSGANTFMYKRKSFEHEKEIRALYRNLPIGENGWTNLESKPLFDHGIKINVDLNRLIDKVYIAPTSPSYLKELVVSLLKKYRIDKEVIQSNLYQNPIK